MCLSMLVCVCVCVCTVRVAGCCFFYWSFASFTDSIYRQGKQRDLGVLASTKIHEAKYLKV